MLLLSRKPGQSIFCHIPGFVDPIKITLISTQGQQAKIGIDADNEIIILREEVQNRNEIDQIYEEQQELDNE